VVCAPLVCTDEALVREAGAFLLQKMVPLLVRRLAAGVATSSEMLQTLFHQLGVNLRYLGVVTTQLQAVTNLQTQFVPNLCLQEMAARAARSVFDELCRAVPSHKLATFVGQFLNALLCRLPHVAQKRRKRTGRRRSPVHAFELWSKIRVFVQERYQYALTDEHLPVIQSMPFLRAVCLKVGSLLVCVYVCMCSSE
jgi:Translation initiation factor eIF3 subunit 135